ncbi:amino acid adenylation domain-containing protein/thioester reductase-like protein [Allocatelliglobosispora scoriae]|uniref:Amino acid adenylation domain-containing protein/thioester reductase-like protein n=1 Tax=Allocatelliglobosispora scoriae TaxID=643052 RepID=A0A841BHH7_9ACTN|nr:non-ribosomal peptide synthetase [Allocatelliglobosispora scoriae]MBB5867085.1 amino acid adenylation domain-containing protein/thioester reductase-like protein [Allocatelliglobosispora scoriae]
MIPLSYAQLRLWFLDRLAAGGAQNAPLALRLHGPVDAAALDAAFGDIVDRHETLRTVFPVTGGEPHQKILPTGTHPKLDVIDWPGTELADLVAELNRAAYQPFDLATEPQLRVALYHRCDETGADEHVLLIVLHHIVSDGWSIGPLLGDLATAYAARTGGTAPHWDDLDVQYADYTLWQRELLGDESDPDSVISRQLAFWTQTLAGAPEELPLPTDRPRPATRTHTAGLVPFRLDAALHQALADLAQAHGATLFMVLQAAVAALLTRHGSGNDILTGTPVAGRTDEALDKLVGFFVNTLVVRTDTAGDPTFAELLARVRTASLAAYAHQDVPFERVVEVLNPARSMARHPVFQVNLVLQSNAAADPEFLGLRYTSQALTSDQAKFDLTAAFAENLDGDRHPAGIDANLEYAAELFDHTTVEGLAARLVRLLTAVTADPQTRIGAVDLLDDELTTIAAWNDTRHDLPETTLTALVEAGRDRHPDRPAVVFGDTLLTHRELHERADRLARHLVAAGAGPGRIVGVAMPRSEHLIVALLAVLKSGAAYLPLDTGYPADRLAFMVTEAAPVLVLTDTATGYPGGVAVDGALTAYPQDDLDHDGLAPGDTAYVIYTSGSTGRPKGVAVPHRAIANRLLWMQHEYALTPADRVLQKTPSSFDVSVWEFFWPLMTGATLVVAAPDGHRDPAYLIDLIQRERVTTLHFVPSMLDVFLAAPGVAGCTSLTRVFASGEALPAESAARFRRLLTAPLHNLYGPTEAAVDVTYQPVGDEPGPVPIGRPVWNTRLHILDAQLRPVPPGVAGELYLGGVQLAHGYLHRAGLTAERFVASPFTAGERIYRTGDLARWRRDGAVEYLGRVDHQVKLRGFRIELAEIESVIAADPGVAQAAVIVREDRPGDQRLVAYVVGTADAAAVRARAALSLPEHMVPASVVLLEALPVTPNGKLDRRALPAPDLTPAPSRPPATPQEALMARLLAEVLGLPAVGVDDDFFTIGGHSLLVIRLVARIAEETGVELGVRTVFDRPTAAGLAAALDGVGGVWDPSRLAADAVLGAFALGTPRPAGPWRNVLLTGATGFLGAFLLRELLDRTGSAVHCLVRAESAAAGSARLRATLDGYGLWRAEDAHRVIAVPGDLAAPGLGLTAAAFAELADLVDAVVHNGARVNHLDPYDRLRAANVTGTREVLRLAAVHATPVHFVSSVSVAVAVGENPDIVDESTRVPADRVVPSGYVATKWVGEELVRAAGAAGLPVTIHRPGRVAGHSATGAWGSDDSFWHYARAIARLGAVAADGLDVGVDLVPVDHVAGALVELAMDPASAGGVFHLVGDDPVPISVVVDGLRAAGYPIREIPGPEWDTLLASSMAAAVASGDRSWASTALLGAGFRTPSVLPDWGRPATAAALSAKPVPPGTVTAATIAVAALAAARTGFYPLLNFNAGHAAEPATEVRINSRDASADGGDLS